MVSIVRSASVYYKDAKSDKEYHISVERSSAFTYSVLAKFGPRNGTLTHVDLTRGNAVRLYDAVELYEKKLHEKLNKGYSYAPYTPHKTARELLIAKMKKAIPTVILGSSQWQILAATVEEHFEEVA